MIPTFPCKDCKVNTCPLDGEREYYEVTDYLWLHDARSPGIGQADHGVDGYFLCIGCLEARIGRRLKINDFKPLPANRPSPWNTDRLNERLGGIPKYCREETEQYIPNQLLEALKAHHKPEIGFNTVTGAYAVIRVREEFKNRRK